LWGEVEIPRDKRVGERYRRLVRKLDAAEASRILSKCPKSIEYFSQSTISNMQNRDIRTGYLGSTAEGDINKAILADLTRSWNERLEALAEILYQIRNNLAHGSKGGFGDDDRIVRNAVKPMNMLLEIALVETQGQL
jgi:uncharacterized protein YukE